MFKVFFWEDCGLGINDGLEGVCDFGVASDSLDEDDGGGGGGCSGGVLGIVVAVTVVVCGGGGGGGGGGDGGDNEDDEDKGGTGSSSDGELSEPKLILRADSILARNIRELDAVGAGELVLLSGISF